MKEDLRRRYNELNPATLRRDIDRLVDRLHSLGEHKAEAESCATLEYIST